MKWLLPFAGFLLLSAGCSSTLVVLVPDPGGKVGRVTVTTDGGQQVLMGARQSTEASSVRRAPRPPETLSQETIQDLFSTALRNEPAPPLSYLLYFQLNTSRLLPGSKQRLPLVFRAIQDRKSCDVSVIGHTDRTGEADYNYALSRQRAKVVKSASTSLGVVEGCMEIRYYGENDPLIPTPHGVAEPRNRRVEVEIR